MHWLLSLEHANRLLKNSFSKTENNRCSYGQKHAIVNDNNMLSGGSDYAR
jgi:hypothetical protein